MPTTLEPRRALGLTVGAESPLPRADPPCHTAPVDQDTLLRLTVERAAELPGTRLTHPFGPETDVHRVKDKLFMLHIDHDGRRLVNLKARPVDPASFGV